MDVVRHARPCGSHPTVKEKTLKPATSRQMILIDDLRRSLDMDDGDVEATVDPDTGEID